MKSLNFIQACKGLMYLLIGIGIASFGIASITNNTAKADNPATIHTAGKIMMSESGFVLNGKAIYHVLVWDSETGKSKLYGYSPSTNTLKDPGYQLPSSPLY